MLEGLFLLQFTKVPIVGRCGSSRWRRWKHMSPHMEIASCSERSDEVRETVVGMGYDEEEKESRKKKWRWHYLCEKRVHEIISLFSHLVFPQCFLCACLKVGTEEGGFMGRKVMNEYLQKCIGEGQEQWKYTCLMQSMGEEKSFQLCGLKCVFFRPLRKRAWLLTPPLLSRLSSLQYTTLSLTCYLFAALALFGSSK